MSTYTVVNVQPERFECRKNRKNIISNLVVIGFDEEHTASDIRANLAKVQKEYPIDMEEVVGVTKDDKGKVFKTALTADREEALRKVLEQT